MGISVLLSQNGMSRGDEISIGDGSNLFVFIICSAVLLFFLFIKILSWFHGIETDVNSKNKKNDSAVIEEKKKIEVPIDKYAHLGKDDIINMIYELMTKKPMRASFGNYSGAEAKYAKAIQSVEKSKNSKDVIISKLSDENTESLKKYLAMLDPEPFDFTNLVNTKK